MFSPQPQREPSARTAKLWKSPAPTLTTFVTPLDCAPSSVLTRTGAFRFVERLSQRAVEVFGERPELWALLLGGLVVGTIIYVLLQTDEPSAEPSNSDSATGRSAEEVGVGAAD